jgi:hypothetical protein
MLGIVKRLSGISVRKGIDSKIPDTSLIFKMRLLITEKLCKLMLRTAKQHIPKGKVSKYNPFWSNFLTIKK